MAVTAGAISNANAVTRSGVPENNINTFRDISNVTSDAKKDAKRNKSLGGVLHGVVMVVAEKG